MLGRLAVAGFTVVVFACGSGGSGVDGGPGDGDGGSLADADPFRPDSIPPPLNAAVYAHSQSALYRVDPNTLGVSLVGPFVWPNGTDSMTDIAIDKDGNMTGVSYSRVYSVNKDTAACTFLANLDATVFNGLSYVPPTSPDPNAPEILVGAEGGSGNVYQIDPQTGMQTLLGTYGGGLGSSGDIVSVRGFGTVATVTSPNATNDQLARIDTATWQATVIGDTGFDEIWGLGFWGDKVYGFTDTSKFLLIDVTTGAGTEVETSPTNWWGAGVTTAAPVIE
jgi:hypothetical protein